MEECLRNRGVKQHADHQKDHEHGCPTDEIIHPVDNFDISFYKSRHSVFIVLAAYDVELDGGAELVLLVGITTFPAWLL